MSTGDGAVLAIVGLVGDQKHLEAPLGSVPVGVVAASILGAIFSYFSDDKPISLVDILMSLSSS